MVEPPAKGLSWRNFRQRLRALWKMDLSPVAVGLGVGLGIFVGCSPFIGLHTLMIFGLAALLRINPWVALLSSQISLPPLFLGIAAAEVWVGEWIRFGHASLPKISDATAFAQWLWSHALGSWLLGSGLLGGLFAVAGGVLAWLIAMLVHALHRRSSLRAASR
jgi:uncharacterized protein (DUF2062 family)